MSGFALDPRLEADTISLGNAALSRVLLMNDARFPWLILVPRRAALAELADLAPRERAALMEEIVAVSAALSTRRGVDKINVGASCTSISSAAASMTRPGLIRFGGSARPDPMIGPPRKIFPASSPKR
jgi:hypothetical protein